jgi:hypothetical protein
MRPEVNPKETTMKRTILLVGIMATVALLGNLSASANSSTQNISQNDVAQGAPKSPIASGAQNVLIVSPSGGNFTSIQAALNSITNNSSRNTFLIWVGPGTYNEQVTMKPYVDIEGAGEKVTKITFPGNSSANTGTVVGASNAELRFLTVENTGGNTYATAIYNSAASPSLLHVTAKASGGSYRNTGIFSYSSSPTMNNVTAIASGGDSNEAVDNHTSSTTMNNVTATASGGASYNTGVANLYTPSSTMNNVTVIASGGIESVGISNYVTNPSMTNVIASASGNASYGGWNRQSSPTISNSILKGDTEGLHNDGGSNVSVQNSQLTGTTFAAYSDTGVTLKVGGSYLSGGRVTGPGTSACAGNYDENYTFYASTCP